jgi:hypothetical protein
VFIVAKRQLAGQRGFLLLPGAEKRSGDPDSSVAA